MSTDQIFRKKCRRGLHPFDAVYRLRRSSKENVVVNWCPICGTLRIDSEVNGRIRFLRARRPKILEEWGE